MLKNIQEKVKYENLCLKKLKIKKLEKGKKTKRLYFVSKL